MMSKKVNLTPSGGLFVKFSFSTTRPCSNRMTGEYFRIAYVPNRKMRRRVLSSSTQLMSHHEIDVHVHLGLGGLPYNQVSEK